MLSPAKYSWQFPAFFDNLFANPASGSIRYISPAQHIAVLKKWNLEYGSEIVFLGGASFELLVAKPPTTKEAAFKLAVEHYLYCRDVLDQLQIAGQPGNATIKHLAAKLLNGQSWHFWWD